MNADLALIAADLVTGTFAASFATIGLLIVLRWVLADPSGAARVGLAGVLFAMIGWGMFGGFRVFSALTGTAFDRDAYLGGVLIFSAVALISGTLAGFAALVGRRRGIDLFADRDDAL